MRHTDLPVAEGVSGALNATWQCFLTFFENAPVMLHSVDRQFRIIRVNRRWLEKMGYERAEVLGRGILDFKSEESRLRTESDTRPLLLRAGATRGIWGRYIRKDGLALNVLTDADLWDHRCCFAYMAMCDEGEDPWLWRQSLATLETLSQISSMNRSFAQALSPGVGGWAPPPPPAAPLDPVPGRETGLAKEALGLMLEASRDTAANLRAMVRIHEDWRDAVLEQQQEQMLVMRNIDKTLAELVDAVSGYREFWS